MEKTEILWEVGSRFDSDLRKNNSQTVIAFLLLPKLVIVFTADIM